MSLLVPVIAVVGGLLFAIVGRKGKHAADLFFAGALVGALVGSLIANHQGWL